MLVRMGGKPLLFEYLYAHHWWSSLDLKEFRLGAVTISSHSAFVNPAGQLLLTRRGKTRMDGVGILFEFYIAPL